MNTVKNKTSCQNESFSWSYKVSPWTYGNARATEAIKTEKRTVYVALAWANVVDCSTSRTFRAICTRHTFPVMIAVLALWAMFVSSTPICKNTILRNTSIDWAQCLNDNRSISRHFIPLSCTSVKTEMLPGNVYISKVGRICIFLHFEFHVPGILLGKWLPHHRFLRNAREALMDLRARTKYGRDGTSYIWLTENAAI